MKEGDWSFDVKDLGSMAYAEALEIQEGLFKGMLEQKRIGDKNLRNTLILVEHTPVYTLGKSGSLENLKHSPESVGAEFFRTSRGGDITYHGPGQIVGYPIFDLEQYGMGIADYISNIEAAIIDVIRAHGLKGERLPDASGVWLDASTDRARKICAIGVKASRYITMHGFAFNVNTDLSYFEHIIPCGIADKGVTSMQAELGQEQPMTELKHEVIGAFSRRFPRFT